MCQQETFLNSLQSFFPLAAALLGYLIGSLSFAVIVSRAMGLNDPRTYGSKNPGATNVLRSGSKAAAIVTLLLDAAKGWLPVMLVKWYGKPYGLEEGTMGMVGLAAFLGHLYPVFFKFVGGKGVATALGVLVGFSWILGLATGATWLIIAYFFRYSSLASLVATVFAPVYYIFGDGTAWFMNKGILLSVGVMSLFLVYRHAENISRLINGTESRLGKKNKVEPIKAEHHHNHHHHQQHK
ncbi:MAG: glycerol-3-phosphate 1-O-acyltransferase PlsY [Rhodoferax sp.]|nr:glycerol-3-phosphate 1-O-acyltransferase PlsY [Rhodoferax sp.]MBP9059981.1 glycerol-3-phosphate 1-O-acyltransferase PlsY [Rhodoferax sp.]MBP9685315.1 glycerol-3-phosphate 1-O-acyltransferase PlsY [Rhodoferax sp.]